MSRSGPPVKLVVPMLRTRLHQPTCRYCFMCRSPADPATQHVALDPPAELSLGLLQGLTCIDVAILASAVHVRPAVFFRAAIIMADSKLAGALAPPAEPARGRGRPKGCPSNTRVKTVKFSIPAAVDSLSDLASNMP